MSVSLRHSTLAVVGGGVLSLVAAACIEPAPLPVTEVRVLGNHGVTLGESVALAASTAGATDSAYRWSVDDEEIAAVDERGVVTGIAPGETVVRAQGVDSLVTGTHALVVIDEPTALVDAPQAELWALSAHSDASAEAFRHWDDEGAVPTSCARCHSSEGYRDYLGDDGTPAGSVETPAPTGSVVRCSTCHNDAARALGEVTFPSGAVVRDLGPEARCMVCHQGRASGADVDEVIAAAGVDDDTAHPALTFTSIHYYPAGATLYAGRARGGYQYEGNVYDARFRHVPGFDSCIGCHEPHSTAVRVERCASCHEGVGVVEDARDIRMMSSFGQDYDGDGDSGEGIYHELVTLRAALLAALHAYGAERALPLCYDGETYPYWFVGGGDDGACAATEAAFENRYQAFTPRSLRAAYNFHLASVDPGAFAHNAKYVIQLLYDSLLDLDEGLAAPLPTAELVRTDSGHFNGAGHAAREWDDDEAVTAACSRCHSGAPGYRFFVRYGVGLDVPETANGLECATCHESFDDFALLEVTKTWLPAARSAALAGDDNLCGNCHVGRASKASYDAAFSAGVLAFQNVHYLPAAGTLYGAVTAIGYQYEGRSYAGSREHTGGARCTTCHDPVLSQHSFLVEDVWRARCDVCHGDQREASELRIGRDVDYDGDGSVTESLAGEIDGMAERVLSAMRARAAVCYDEERYPYFFDDEGGCAAAPFGAWTEPLLKAAHNYQLAQKEPGAWAHNFDYMAQLLFDSVEDLEGDTTAMTRP